MEAEEGEVEVSRSQARAVATEKPMFRKKASYHSVITTKAICQSVISLWKASDLKLEQQVEYGVELNRKQKC